MLGGTGSGNGAGGAEYSGGNGVSTTLSCAGGELPDIAWNAFSDVIGIWPGVYLGNSPITLGEKEL